MPNPRKKKQQPAGVVTNAYVGVVKQGQQFTDSTIPRSYIDRLRAAGTAQWLIDIIERDATIAEDK